MSVNPPSDEIVAGGKCDFCSPPRMASWEYPARTFIVPSTVPGVKTYASNGGWLACDPCAELIEANDTRTLVNRLPNQQREVRETYKRIVTKFFENRTGERVAFG